MVRNNISIRERDKPQIDASNTKSSRNIIPSTKKIFPPREKTKQSTKRSHNDREIV